MKRTTIMIEEDLLYDLKQVAQQQNASMASVIREALQAYVVEQHKLAQPDNPLLRLAGLGESAEMTDLSDGKDEDILRAAAHPIYGWSVVDERSG